MSSFKAYNLGRALADHFEHSKPPVYTGFSAQVFRALSLRIGCGSMSITDVAEDLGISTVELQENLREEEASFDEIRERLRRQVSLYMLMLEKKTSSEIYVELGFPCVNSLSESFRRWTGLAPDIFFRLYQDHVDLRVLSGPLF